ncbi:MAG: Diguanylate phosphodiesterase metal dependent hydrolase domain containing [Desulfovibrionaceae bacterium]|nr:MAG: Diguanylate phosphodiesterase metal dependent hydrolase domain containing [Desulfovibrionaceae bacterium]
MGIPMDEVLKDLPLTPALAEALSGERNKAHELLSLAQDLERADWKAVGSVLQGLQLPANTASRLHADALRFTGELMRDVCVLPQPAGKMH